VEWANNSTFQQKHARKIRKFCEKCCAMTEQDMANKYEREARGSVRDKKNQDGSFEPS
jgi:hypothetical protein